MRLSKKILLSLSVCVVITAALARYFVYVPVIEPPALTGALTDQVLDVSGTERRFAVYQPAQLVESVESVAAVIMLHGARGSGARIRRVSGYGFDTLADNHGFVVAYPEAYERHWNDCLAAAEYRANIMNIDDVAFMRELVSLLVDEYAVNRDQIFVAGLANGGQMAYRLALEAPDLVRAAAVIAANLPTEQNQSCTPAEKALPVMIVNGTADPINPFDGGEVTLIGPFISRGTVRSAQASAQYWADLAGYSAEPFFHHYPDSNAGDGSFAERMVWSAPGRPEIALVTIDGGGHTIPGPGPEFPHFLGPVNRDFSAIEEVWRFFAREMEVTAL
jgi:polyhydroxybutyrate depolymerase